MSKKVLTLVAALVLTSTAMADIHLDFGVSELNLDYTVGSQLMTIESSNASTLDAWLLDGASVLDYLQVKASDLGTDVLYTLNLAFTQFGVDDWRAVGTFSMRDTVQEVVAANFTSTNVYIDDTSYELKIKGYLLPVSPNAGVLVPSAYTWNMTDGTDTITVLSATSYDNGVMINTQFTTWGGWTEDEFFTGNIGSTPVPSISLMNGDSRIAITPVPAGVLLGIIGLSMVGARMRKYA